MILHERDEARLATKLTMFGGLQVAAHFKELWIKKFQTKDL